MPDIHLLYDESNILSGMILTCPLPEMLRLSHNIYAMYF